MLLACTGSITGQGDASLDPGMAESLAALLHSKLLGELSLIWVAHPRSGMNEVLAAGRNRNSSSKWAVLFL
jgi:hypothetical protein